MKKTWSRQQEALAAECRKYFKERAVFRKLFAGFREKYASYGSFSGTVVLRNLTGDDIEELEGFLQKSCHGKKSVSVSAGKFEKALADSRFHIFSPQEVLELYFQEEMTGKREQEQKKQQARAQMLAGVRGEYEGSSRASAWLEEIMEGSGDRDWLLKKYREAGEDTGEFERLLKLGAEILERLPCYQGRAEYLAVFAAEITGNPHAFDSGTKEGQLLYRLVQRVAGMSSARAGQSGIFPALKEQRQYFAAGILKDDVSNYAMVSGIRAGKKYGSSHAGMEGFLAEGDMVQVPLSVIAGWEWARCPDGCMYIVENPSVYAVFAGKWRGKRACMCMNGQPRLSSVLLLDLLAKTGTKVYYAGDLDPEGLLIAQKTGQYYKGEFHYWHMSSADYERSRSKETISEKRLKILDKITDERLRETVLKIRQEKTAGYQENMWEMFLKQ